jgi:hypothetical protein
LRATEPDVEDPLLVSDILDGRFLTLAASAMACCGTGLLAFVRLGQVRKVREKVKYSELVCACKTNVSTARSSMNQLHTEHGIDV